MLVPPTNFGIVEDGVYRASYVDPINFSFLETLSLKSILLLDVEQPPKQFYTFLQKSRIQLYQISNRKLKIKQPHLKPPNLELTNGNSKIGTGGAAGATATATDIVGVDGQRQLEPIGDNVLVPVSTNTSNFSDEIADNELKKFEKSIIYIYNDTSLNSKKDDWMVIKRNLLSKIFEILLNKNTYNIMIVDSMDVIVSILRKIEKWNYSNLINEYRMYANKNKTYQVENFLDIIQIELTPFKNDKSSLDNEVGGTTGNTTDQIKKLNSREEEVNQIVSETENLKNSSKLSEKFSSIPSTPNYGLDIDESSRHMKNSWGSNSTRGVDVRQNSMASIWSAESYDYLANSPSAYRSPRDIFNSNNNNISNNNNSGGGNSYGLPIVDSFRSLRSQENSYDNSYKSMLQSMNDTTENDVSSSPQIPDNLLRLIEMRKKKKTTSQDGPDDSYTNSDGSQNRNGDKDSKQLVKNANNTGKQKVGENPEHKSLLSAELAHLNINSELQRKAKTATEDTNNNLDSTIDFGDKYDMSLPVTPNEMSETQTLRPVTNDQNDYSIDTAAADATESPTREGRGGSSSLDEEYHYVFYKPLLVEKYGGVKNHVKIKLPPEEVLPEWFKYQRQLWVEEYIRLNNLQEN